MEYRLLYKGSSGGAWVAYSYDLMNHNIIGFKYKAVCCCILWVMFRYRGSESDMAA